MKTFDICSDCNGHHHWREIDYDNVLYVSQENAISLTLCPSCLNKFNEATKTNSLILRYKNKISSVLLGKSKTITSSNKQNANVASFWGLSF